MAFDFPSAPTVGDIHTEAGVEYQYAGNGVWDLAGGGMMTDYVLKAGDTMVGPLLINGPSAPGQNLSIGSAAGIRTISLNPSSGNHAGLIEFWDPTNGTTRRGYIGYGLANDSTTPANNYLNINPEGGKIHINGNGLAMQENAGIHWGSTSAKTDVNDFSEGICLYGWGGTSKFGFSITSGTLNVSVENAANHIDFNIGGARKVRINNAGGLAVQSAVPASFAGPVSFNTGSHIEMNNTIIYCDSDSTYDGHVLQIFRQEDAQVAQIRGYAGASEGGVRFHCNNGGYGWCDNWRSNVTSGGGLYVGGDCSAGSMTDRGTAATKRDISACTAAETVAAFAALQPKRFRKVFPDPVDVDGQPLPEDKRWRDDRMRFGFVADDLYANAATRDIVTLAVIPDTGGQQEIVGTDIMQVLALAVAKIKLLEAEIELLKKKR